MSYENKTAEEEFGIDPVRGYHEKGLAFCVPTNPIWRELVKRFIAFCENPRFAEFFFDVREAIKKIKNEYRLEGIYKENREFFEGTQAGTSTIARELKLAYPQYADRIITRKCRVSKRFYDGVDLGDKESYRDMAVDDVMNMPA